MLCPWLMPVEYRIVSDYPRRHSFVLVADLPFRCFDVPTSLGGNYLQDRYAGDVGDYVKLALLRAISPGQKLGVAWYLYPDEGHNADGRHITYLDQPGDWRDLDAELFDALSNTVRSLRSVQALEATEMLAGATFVRDQVSSAEFAASARCDARTRWFMRVTHALAACDIVFADPDNGLIDDSPYRRRERKFGKQMPLSEALALAENRQLIIYHHNTRYPGGHDLEVKSWQVRLGPTTVALRANAYSCRTFFIVNPSEITQQRAMDFAQRWSNHKVRFVAAL